MEASPNQPPAGRRPTPPRRGRERVAQDPRLALLCTIAARLTGLDAAVTWIIDRHTGDVCWGHAGLSATTWEQMASLRLHLDAMVVDHEGEETIQIAHADPVRLPGLPSIACVAAAPIGHAQSALFGLLAVLGQHATPLRSDVGPILDQLRASVPDPHWGGSQALATSGLDGALYNSLRSLKIGTWSYDVKTRQILLGKGTRDILGLHDVTPAKARSGFFLGAFDLGSATEIYTRFLRCIQDGSPVDVHAQLSETGGRSSGWVHLVGELVSNDQGMAKAIRGVIQDVSERKRAQLDAARLAKRLSTVVGSINEAFITLDRHGRCTYLNSESEELLACRSGELLHQFLWQNLDESTGNRLKERIGHALVQKGLVEFEFLHQRSQKWLEVKAYPYSDGLVLYLRDVTDRRTSQNELALLQAGIAQLNDVVIIAESVNMAEDRWRIIFVNEAFTKLTGFTRGELMDRAQRRDSAPAVRFAPLDKLIRTLAQLSTDAARRHELRMTRADGSRFWLDFDVVPIYGVNDQAVYWVAVGRDISERRAADAKIQHLAFYDPLTDLPNREHLIERLRSTLARSRRNPQYGALMFIDLDHFKVLNDTMGHDIGDQLLQHVAHRLRHAIRKTDVVARIGGDEFVILLDNLHPTKDTATQKAEVVASKIRETLAEPFELPNVTHYGAASIGVTLFTGQHHSVAEVLKQADLAMYQAKAEGRNTVVFFDPLMQAAFNARAALNADLVHGLKEENQFVLHYQPQYDRNRRIVGVEALVRWNHPQHGLMLPGDFIPIAEDNDLIQSLGAWVIQAACQQLALWQQHPLTRELTLSINVSVKQFRHPQFVDQVLATAREAGVDTRKLQLELTESVLADPQDSTVAKMRALKKHGLSLVLDDFGTGYSSLSYLKQLPLDELKIDKSFVDDILNDASDATIANAIIDLAHNLRLPVIAEGIETDAQYDFLHERGCDYFQGFLLARPMPPSQLLRVMAENTEREGGVA